MSVPCAAKCEDQSDEFVTQKAAALGVRTAEKGGYSCGRARDDGACGHPIAREFCPKTCNNCEAPPPWTWCRVENSFCLASQSFCDSNTKCGDSLKNSSECGDAAKALGLNLTVNKLDSIDAPYGCFQTLSQDQLSLIYYNKNTSASFSADSVFAKSLCSTRQTGNASHATCNMVCNIFCVHLAVSPIGNGSLKTLDVCGQEQRALVYEVDAMDVQAAILNLTKGCKSAALRIRPGDGIMNKDVGIMGTDCRGFPSP